VDSISCESRQITSIINRGVIGGTAGISFGGLIRESQMRFPISANRPYGYIRFPEEDVALPSPS